MFSARIPSVVVAGSVLIDIVFDIKSDSIAKTSVGKVTDYRVGGCAFNIFEDLKHLGVQPYLFSAIRRSTPFKAAILAMVKSAGARRRYIKQVDSAPEALFVAFSKDGHAVSSSTSTVVERAELRFKSLEAEMRKSQCCVIDLSLSDDQIAKIMNLGAKHGRPIICNGTSDGRIVKIRNMRGEGLRLNALVCKDRELAALLDMPIKDIIKLTPQDVCERCRCEFLVVTLAEGGFYHFDAKDAIPTRVAAVPVEGVVSSIGAGDAITACYAAEKATSIREGRSFSFDLFRNHIQGLMPAVLQSVGSVPGDKNVIVGGKTFSIPGEDNGRTLFIPNGSWQAWASILAIGIAISGLVFKLLEQGHFLK